MKLLNGIVNFGSFPIKVCRKLLEFTIAAWRIRRYVDQGFRKNFYQFLFLYIHYDFMPMESFHYGLISPLATREKCERFFSRKKMTQLQRSINPESLEYLTEDKCIFYRLCEKMEVPIPKTYAYFFKKSPGWSILNYTMKHSSDWIALFHSSELKDFVVKPSRGVYGHGIRMYFKSDSAIIDESGQPVSPEATLDYMQHHPEHDDFVIQERLRSHADLAELCGSDFLHTFRVITLMKRKKRAEILHAFYKPIVGANVIDNHAHGILGNLICEVAVESGRLHDAVKLSPRKPGLTQVTHHPDTNIPLKGFPIPCWADICRLAQDAAIKFIPVQTIGWDIALTDDGPYVIEANMLYDPLIYGKMDILLPRLLN